VPLSVLNPASTPAAHELPRFKRPRSPHEHSRCPTDPQAAGHSSPPGPGSSCLRSTERCADQGRRRSRATVRRYLSGHRRVSAPEASLLAPGIVAGTGLGCGGSSVPGPTASPDGWTVSAGNDHRPTEERRQTGQRPSRRVGLATGAFAASMACSFGRALGGLQSLHRLGDLCPVSPTPSQSNG
jgi:hypothetical protein